MDFVIDANILFSALIKEGLTAELLFIDSLHFYAPEFIFMEFAKHEQEILDKTERTPEEFYNLMDVLKRRVSLMPLEELVPFLEKAEKISPDPADVAYVASALFLNIPIWSNDKILKKNQKEVAVYSTEDILDLLEKQPL